MVDISTGKQRGIVPFVDETTGRLPDQYLPQGVIDLQGDLEQAVTDASASATSAASSASNAGQSASSASASASQAGESASQANGFASTASQAATTATGAASNASASASAAQQSASGASASAQAAHSSETNAASSASAAKVSETNAASSASAAREAVEGFGLEVGTTTTGEPGSDAAVEIQKTGTRYTANFTIPRGDKGADGVNENVPLGTATGVVAQASDAYPALPRKVQVHGRTIENPSGVNTVKPTKLVVAGKNLASVTSNSNNPNLLISGILPPGDYVFSAAGNVLEQGYTLKAGSLDGDNIIGFSNSQTTKFSLTQYASIFLNMYTVGSIENIQIEKGASATQFEQPVKRETNLPSDISLADGDTLTIDRDGTTRIVHAEGEPTVLENVTLPELPAPTFNVYTAGGSIQPTVDVDYERDVNLVLQSMEAKIAALEVNQTIIEQGA